ncbi:MAG TPA: hypothetical protein VGI03_15210 [Verrucomicrobiae bacterium]|jgi:hypothetical protein
MILIFAQANVDSLPANWLKNMVVFTIAIIAATSFACSAFVTILQYILEKRRDAKSSTEAQPREILPQPLGVEKMSKRYNHDAHELRFKSVEETVERHGAEIGKLWDTLRIDLPSMERRLDKANEERVGNVHERVNEILGEVKELRGEIRNRE